MVAGRQALIDGTLRALDGRIEGGDNQSNFERTLRRHLNPMNPDLGWAANLLGRSRPEYESGWAKLMMGRGETLTSEERAAVAVGTNTQGGYLVPTHLDPTVILTSSGSANAVRQIARVVTLTQGNVWHGVSSAGVVASTDAELAEVSDDSPTPVGNPSVTLYTNRAFAKASIEAFEDIASLSSDILMMFADARDVLEGANHCTGTGSAQPTGIFTAIHAVTARRVTSTTAATIGLVDIQALNRAVAVRWRRRGTWVMAPVYMDAIQTLGTALSASYSTNITQANSGTLRGRPVVETDDAPTTQTTTALDDEIVFGDFSNYIVADKPGSMSVEFVPHLFNTNANLPDGQRGWFAYWRNGANAVNTSAFAILVDKTSA